MKNTFKRTLALALAVAMVLSVSVIGVSAEEPEVALNGGVMTDTVAVYEFWQEKYASDSNFLMSFGATDMTTTLKNHYDNEELNWRVAWNTAAADSCTGKSLFSAGRPYHYVQIGKATGNNFYGLYLRNPGAGTYDVTLNYSVTNDQQAATEMKAYLFPAAFVDNGAAGGTQWKYMISNNDNKAEDGTDTNGIIYLGSYSCYDAEVAQYEERSLVKENVVLDGGEEYILVLAAYSCTNESATTMKHYTNSLAIEKTVAEAKEANVVAYDFYNKPDSTAYSGTWYANSQTIYNNYASSGWRYEAASALYQMTVSNSFYSTTTSMRFFSGANNWYAIRINAPAAGTYTVTLDYGKVAGKAGVGDVYMFPASVMDSTLNLAELDKTQTAVAALLTAGTLTDSDLTLTGSAAASKLGALQAADMFSTTARGDADKTDANGGNAINNYLEGKINTQLAADTCTTLFTGIEYYADANARASEISKTTVTFPAVGSAGYSSEYIVVFKLTAGSDLYNNKLTFNEVVSAPVAAKIGETEYSTIKAALNAAAAGDTVTLLADGAVADLGAVCDIDLNGKNLTVYGDLTAIGTISDSKDGAGLLKVTGNMNLTGEQAQLPLYNAAAGGYGLYDVVWGENNQSEAAEGIEGAQTFWFQLSFTNADAYTLIASGTSGLKIGVDLAWVYEETPSEAKCVFAKADGAQAYAATWASWILEKEPANPWFYVTVRNAIEGMTVTPGVEANGVAIACDPIAY